jgi:hypothetical protein
MRANQGISGGEHVRTNAAHSHYSELRYFQRKNAVSDNNVTVFTMALWNSKAIDIARYICMNVFIY